MSSPQLFELVAAMLQTEGDGELESPMKHFERLERLARVVDKEYEPLKMGGSGFLDRAAKFVQAGAAQQSQRLLLKLLSETTFVDSVIYDGLLLAAFQTRVLPWITRISGLSFLDPNLSKLLEAELAAVHYFGLTDSFDTSKFFHLNRLNKQRVRPDIRSLKALSEGSRIADLLSSSNRRFVVVLDDFVGSGVQSTGPLKFLASAVSELPILVVPIVVCPQGLNKWARDLKGYPNISIAPLWILGPEDLLGPPPFGRTDSEADQYRAVLSEIDSEVNSDNHSDYSGAMGFEQVGATYVRFSNCPNNSISALHYESRTWTPPFPRATR